MSEFAPILISFGISLLVSLIMLGILIFHSVPTTRDALPNDT